MGEAAAPRPRPRHRGGAFGAFGVLVGVVAREARTAVLVAFLVALPLVLLGLLAEGTVEAAQVISKAFPFSHAVDFFQSSLYDNDPWSTLAREAAWLVGLAAAFGAAARLECEDCWRERLSGHPPAPLPAHRRPPRTLVRETRLDLRDFVYPLFACPGAGVEKPLEGLPGIAQRSVDRLADEAEELLALGIGAVLPLRDPGGEGRGGLGRLRRGRHRPAGAARSRGARPRAGPPHRRLPLRVHVARPLRRRRDGEVVNDLSLELLAKTAVSHAEAGATPSARAT